MTDGRDISIVCPARGAAPQARLRASSTRYGAALQMRDPGFLKLGNRGPGSAAHHFAALMLRRARDT